MENREITPVKAVETLEIPFYGSTLTAIKGVNGVNYTAPKRITEDLGLDWAGQFTKLKDHPVIGPVIGFISTTAADGKNYQMIGLPVDMVPGWLLNINSSRVSPENRDALLRYQREAFGVLSRAFLPKEVLAPKQDWGAIADRISRKDLAKWLLESEEAREQAEAALEAAQPAIDFHQQVTANPKVWKTMQEVSDILNIPELGEIKLFRFLRAEKILMVDDLPNGKRGRNWNLPYRQYIEAGYFRVDEVQDRRNPDFIHRRTLVSQKGIDYILRRWNQACARRVPAHA